jgi:hypothetical protein
MAGSAGQGRPKGARNKRTLAALELVGDQGPTPCSFALELMRRIEQPLNVRMEAARIAAPYIHPRPQPQGRVVSFELPEEIATPPALGQIHATILCAVANSDLSVDEAKDISAIIESHRRTIETVALEERINRLEKALGGQNK